MPTLGRTDMRLVLGYFKPIQVVCTTTLFCIFSNIHVRSSRNVAVSFLVVNDRIGVTLRHALL